MTGRKYSSRVDAAIIPLAGLVGMLLLTVTAPSASAATCTNTWAASGSGSWNVSANWVDGDGDPDNNVPTIGDVACVNQPGTYTVTIVDNGNTNNGTADVLELGDGDTGNGTVTLSVLSSTSSGNPMSGTLNLTAASEPSTIRADGVIELSGTGSNPGQTQFLAAGATVNNAGVIRSVAGTGGNRLFNIPLNNQAGGTVNIAYNAAQGFTRTWTNNGSFDIADGARFTMTGSGNGPTFNQSGGTLTTNTSGVFFEIGGFFNHTGGTQSGNQVQLCGAQLQAPSGGAGAYDFVRSTGTCSGGSISGDIAANKTVRMNNTSGTTMGVQLANNLTNNGTLVLTGTAEDQLLGGFTLTNNGTFRTTGTGARYLDITMSNTATGSVDITVDTSQGQSRTWTNNGSFDVAAGKTMSITGGGQGPTFNQSGGTLTVAGTLDHSGAYNSTGGTTNVLSGGEIKSASSIALTGGTLKGTGTITVPTLNNTGGTVHPGGSPGILTLKGNYTQAAGGTLAVEIAGPNPGTGYSRLAVTGNATLAGTLDVTNTIQPPGGQQFQVLTSTGAVGGTFGSAVVHGPPTYDIVYHSSDVTLTARAPAAPNLTGTSPGSGANDNNPRILGSAPAGSTVKIYDNASCTGSAVATGTAAQLTSPGIAVTVADNSTTTFHATATDSDNTSTCSVSSVTYAEITPPDNPPPSNPPVTPPVTPPANPPAAKPGTVSITKGPARKTTKKAAKFTFSAPDAAGYECSLDQKPMANCTSPVKYKKLKPGKHRFQVHAIGPGGDVGATTTYKWKVKKK